MIQKILTFIASTLFLFVGCSSRLGFKTTYLHNDGITESTQGISADLDIDTSP